MKEDWEEHLTPDQAAMFDPSKSDDLPPHERLRPVMAKDLGWGMADFLGAVSNLIDDVWGDEERDFNEHGPGESGLFLDLRRMRAFIEGASS